MKIKYITKQFCPLAATQFTFHDSSLIAYVDDDVDVQINENNELIIIDNETN